MMAYKYYIYEHIQPEHSSAQYIYIYMKWSYLYYKIVYISLKIYGYLFFYFFLSSNDNNNLSNDTKVIFCPRRRQSL